MPIALTLPSLSHARRLNNTTQSTKDMRSRKHHQPITQEDTGKGLTSNTVQQKNP